MSSGARCILNVLLHHRILASTMTLCIYFLNSSEVLFVRVLHSLLYIMLQLSPLPRTQKLFCEERKR